MEILISKTLASAMAILLAILFGPFLALPFLLVLALFGIDSDIMHFQFSMGFVSATGLYLVWFTDFIEH